MNIKVASLIRKYLHQCSIQSFKSRKKQTGLSLCRSCGNQLASFFVASIACIFLQACMPENPFQEKSVAGKFNEISGIEKKMQKTKLVCFGRYAMSVPVEAALIWGGASFPSTIEVIEGGLVKAKDRIQDDIGLRRRRYNTFEILYEGAGPIDDSLQIRYYEDKYAKADDAVFLDNYVMKGDWTFIFGDAKEASETDDALISRQVVRARSLHLRSESDVPNYPGYCIEKGFMASDLYNDQEMVNAGLYIPTFPDVAFSISSNKDAYSGLKKDDFDRMKREELGLLARIQGAQEIQGNRYPERTVLREGKRAVQHWQGEESLVRRADGTHDFEWCSIGTPKNVADPAEFTARMYTKVADNLVGAAQKSSLSDEEAIALWDKLLNGLKFRVKVPGAPEGSYYFPQDVKPDAGTKP